MSDQPHDERGGRGTSDANRTDATPESDRTGTADTDPTDRDTADADSERDTAAAGRTDPDASDSRSASAMERAETDDPEGLSPEGAGEGANAHGSDALMWISGIVSLLGLWIAASPFVYDTTVTALWNNLLIGAAVFLIAGYNYYRYTDGLPTSVGAMSLVAILGVWTLATPFVVEMVSDAAFWSNVITGLLIALLAGYVAYAGRSVEATAPARAEA